MKPGEREAITRRETRFLPDGTYVFRDELEIKGVFRFRLITCTAWLLELFQVRSGAVSLRRGEEHVRPRGKCFGIFYPRFSIAELCFENTHSRVLGFAGTGHPLAGFATVPTIFEADIGALSAGESAAEILRGASNPSAVELNPKASALSVRAKKHIDGSCLGSTAIGAIAAKLRVRHEHLSRQFKRDFGLSPRDYLHRLRLADAPLRLAQGEEIVGVSHELGYYDLSRFYRQFRKHTKTSPGVCRAMLKPTKR